MKELDEALDGVEKVVDPVRGTRIAAKVGILLLGACLMAGLVQAVRRVTGGALENAAAQGEAAVSDEDWFARKAAEIRALDLEIEAAKEAYARKSAEASDRWISRQDDRTELDRLNALILSLSSRRAEAVSAWDALAISTGIAQPWSGSR